MDVKKILDGAAASQASYAVGLTFGLAGDELATYLTADQFDSQLTLAQARSFADSYSVISQTSNSQSGFSATLFREKTTGKYVFAMRGSNELSPDWTVANLQNLLSGVASHQIVDMLNFYLVLSAPASSTVAQYEYDVIRQSVSLPSPGPEYTLTRFGNNIATYEGVIATGTATGTGSLENAAQISVTGHSLGGHLASAFALLVPAATEQLITFNSAGFIGWLGSSFPDFANLLSRNISEVVINTNLSASVPVVDIATPMDWVSGIPGTNHLGTGILPLSIEQQHPGGSVLHGHRIDPLVDSLAVGALLDALATGKNPGDLPASLQLQTISNIIDFVSIESHLALERIVAELQSFFLLPTLDVAHTDNNNVYRAIPQVLDAAPSHPMTIMPVDHTNMNSVLESAMEGNSEVSVGFRYALVNLLPMAFTSGAANSAAGLPLYDRVNMSDQYLSDRAFMLSTMTHTASENASSGRISNPTKFTDLAKEISFDGDSEGYPPAPHSTIPITPEDFDPQRERIVFGSHANNYMGSDSIEASNNDDHLYGLGGDDEILGLAGDDYIEGGTGSDQLHGGQDSDMLYGNDGNDQLYGGPGTDYLVGGKGADTFYWNAGDGNDYIGDYDDAGDRIVVDGVDTSAISFHRISAGSPFYRSRDLPDITLHADGGTLSLIRNTAAGTETLYVSQYSVFEGNYGIALREQTEMTVPAGVVITELGLGDGQVTVYAHERSLQQTAIASLPLSFTAENVSNYLGGNLFGTNGGAFEGGPKSDQLAGGAGQNALHGLSGDDLISGADGWDYLAGGAGSDTIHGGDGVDAIFGSERVSLLERSPDPSSARELYYQPHYADQPGDENVLDAGSGDDFAGGSGQRDDISGGEGNDHLLGGAGGDFISGGSGSDRLYGDSMLNFRLVEVSPGAVGAQFDIAYAQDDALSNYDDHIHGGDGHDIILGELGDDILYGDAGDDFIGGDRAEPGSGFDSDLPAYAGTFPELNMFDHGDDQLYGGSGMDILAGHHGDDLLAGGPDADILRGGWGDDSYLLQPGDGVDQIEDSQGRHTLVLQGFQPHSLQVVLQGNQVRVGRGEDWLTLARAEWHETDLAITSADNLIESTSLETLHLDAEGNVLLRVPGLRGLNVLERNSIFSIDETGGTPRIVAGPETSGIAVGTAGSGSAGARIAITSASGLGINLHTPLYNTSDAAQLLNLTASSEAAVSITGLTGSFSGSDGHDVLSGDAASNVFSGNGGDDHLQGLGGDDALYGGAGDDTLEGGAGADSLSGSLGRDTVTGGPGDDAITGGHGDTYHFSAGDGIDVITVNNDGGPLDMGTIFLGSGIDPGNLSFSVSGQNVAIGYGSNNVIHLAMNSVFWPFDNALSRFSLVSERGASALPLITQADATNTVYGSFGADHIVAGALGVAIIPGYGDDIIETSENGSSVFMNSRYMANADNGIGHKQIHLRGAFDTIYAPVHQGITFHYDNRDSQASIHYDWSYPEINPYTIALDASAGEIGYQPRGEDVLVLGDGLRLDDLSFIRTGNTLSIGIGAAPDNLTFEGFFTSFDATTPDTPPDTGLLTQEGHIADLLTNPHVLAAMPRTPVAWLRFDDGSAFNLATVLDERLERYELLPGATVVGSLLDDHLSGSAGDNDVIQGFSGDDVIQDAGGTNLIDAGSGNDNITVSGTNTVHAGSGQDRITSQGGMAVIDAGAGADEIGVESGFAAVQLREDSGIDRLDIVVDESFTALDIAAPFSVHDVFFNYYDLGPESYLQLSLNNSESSIRVGALNAAGDAVPGRTVNLIRFADGTTLNEAEIFARTGLLFGTATNFFLGTAAADNLTGSSGDDFFLGDDGNDRLHGNTGHDLFVFSGVTHGYDRITGGAGYDLIAGLDGNDLIGLAELTPQDSIERIDGRGGVFNVIGGDGASNLLDFSATEIRNIVAIVGGGGNDTLVGSAQADYISGDTGDDSITGGGGDDTLFGKSGNDVFIATGTESGYDEIDGGAGFDVLLGGDGNDLLGLRHFTGASSVERIDGGASVFNVIGGNAAHNTLDFSATELVNILAIVGDAGDDIITGSAAGEFIRGDDGNDTLRGGAGSDVLVGSAGSDLYLFSPGDGIDMLRNEDASASVDTLSVSGLAYDELWFSRSDNHLVMDAVGANDSVLLENWYTDSAAQIDRFTAGDRVLQRNQVDQLVNAMASFDAPDGVGAYIPADIRLQLEPTLTAVWQAA